MRLSKVKDNKMMEVFVFNVTRIGETERGREGERERERERAAREVVKFRTAAGGR